MVKSRLSNLTAANVIMLEMSTDSAANSDGLEPNISSYMYFTKNNLFDSLFACH